MGVTDIPSTAPLPARVSDAGVDDSFMKRLGSELQSGSAAPILLVRQANMEKMLSAVDVPGEVIQSSLNTDTVAWRTSPAASGPRRSTASLRTRSGATGSPRRST